MPRVMFTRRPHPYEVAAGDPAFEAGRVYDLPAASVARWKRRGAVVDAPPEEARPAPEPVVKAAAPAAEPEPAPAETAEAPAPQPVPRKRKARTEPTD